ncbi:hypothetical protein [uncultured Clostridium sp.]|uniref:hypothetical protein n=1 Tax=uncultured Clostridium sp. TaxID=59620 RepID=UPI00261594BD|nr:hypothetical protein [uncultured Clostridium sp.]
MDKDMERKMNSMTDEIKYIQTLLEKAHYGESSLSYLGDYYIDNIIETACEIMGD